MKDRPGVRTVERRRTGPIALLLFLLGSALGHVLVGASLSLVTLFPVEPRPKKVEPIVSYVEVEEEKPELEPPEQVEPPEPKPTPKWQKKKPKVEFEELPEPEPEEEKPEEEKPEEKPEEPQPPVDFVVENMKSVEQPDDLDEKEAPEDPNYLSNVNRDVEQETRAELTNLEKDAKEQQAKQLEESPEKQTGTANEDVIAQEQEHKSQLNRQAPNERPSPEEKRPEQQDPKPKSLLAMRETEHRDHQLPQEAYEALAEQSPDGALRADQQKQASIAPQNQQARIDKNDEVYKFKLSQQDMDALFGKDPDAKKSYMAKRESKRKGVWDETRSHWQSPLENMVPEVQVGNQTALRSRKHPFARYIAQMHRKIHEAWAWRYLDQLDTRGRNHPLNDFNLWTRVEIVLNGDGTIDKVMTVRSSGAMAFDAAAREIVHSSGPFPDPPKEILSGNGKIYMHWAFHRDERACGTFLAEPFILDNAGQGDRPNPNQELTPGRGGGETLTRRLSRGPSRGPAAPAIPEGPAPPPGHGSGGGHDHDHDHDHGDGGGAGNPTGPASGSDTEMLAADPQAKKAANEWLHYFAVGKVDKVVARSTLPFYSGETIVARNRDDLGSILSTMIEESKAAGKPKAANIYTAAGLRKVFGSAPTGVQEGTGRVYGLTKVGSEFLILVLEKKFGVWKVTGVAR